MTSMELTPQEMESFTELRKIVKPIARNVTFGRNCANYSFDDAIQDGLIALCVAIQKYQKYPKYHENYTIQAFAYSYVERRIRDAMRKHIGAAGSRRRAFAMSKSDKGLDMAEDRGTSGFGRIDTHDQVLGVFARLGSRQRMLLRAYFIRSKTMNRIAEELGKSTGWVSINIRETIAKLAGKKKLNANMRGGFLHSNGAA